MLTEQSRDWISGWLDDLGPEAREGERTAAGVRILLFGIVFLVQAVLIAVGPEEDFSVNVFIAAVAFLALVPAFALRFFLARHYHPALSYLITVVDVVALFVVDIAASTALGQVEAATKWTSFVGIFFVIVVAAGLRFSTRLVIFSGALCALLYFLMLLPARGHFTTSYRDWSGPEVNPLRAAVLTVFLALATYIVWKLVSKAQLLGGLRSRRSGSPDFAAVASDPAGAAFLASKWEEAERCFSARAPLAAVVLLASVLEGALLDLAKSQPAKTGVAPSAPRDERRKVKEIRHWHLADLINVAAELRWISRKSFAESLRDYRNMIHPAQSRGTPHSITMRVAEACRADVLVSLDELASWRRTAQGSEMT